MCPGLTSSGAEMVDAEAGDVVVRAPGRPLSCWRCVGVLSSELRCHALLCREFSLKASSTQWLLAL